AVRMARSPHALPPVARRHRGRAPRRPHAPRARRAAPALGGGAGMRQVHAVAGALVAWGTAAAVGFVLNRAVTDRDGALLGLDNHVWMTIAWWTVFAVLPLVAILDASVIPQEDWWAAHS